MTFCLCNRSFKYLPINRGKQSRMWTVSFFRFALCKEVIVAVIVGATPGRMTTELHPVKDATEWRKTIKEIQPAKVGRVAGRLVIWVTLENRAANVRYRERNPWRCAGNVPRSVAGADIKAKVVQRDGRGGHRLGSVEMSETGPNVLQTLGDRRDINNTVYRRSYIRCVRIDGM